MNLIDVIKTLSDKGNLNKELSSINERSIEKAKNSGRGSNIGSFNFESRDVYTDLYVDTPKKILPLVDNFLSGDEILSKTFLINNPLVSTKIPLITSNQVSWKELGFPVEVSPSIESKDIYPYRLTANCKISKNILNQNQVFEEQFKTSLFRSISDKLVRSIFSKDAASDDNPKGLFNGTPTTLATINDVIDMMVDLDKKQSKNTFIISPTAKQNLIKLSQDYSILDHNTLFGAEFICDPRVEDSYIAYIDLSKLAVVLFGDYSLDVDGFSDAVDNKTTISINAYYDFTMIDDSFIKVGKF